MKDQIKNVPEYAHNHEIWVVRIVKDKDGSNTYWFYGAYDDPKKSLDACAELNNGMIIYH